MINSRKKRIGVVIVAVTLSVVLLAGAGIGIAYYRNYHEEPIPAQQFLDRPDAITAYYKDEQDKLRTQKLSEEEIDRVHSAFLELTTHFVGTSRSIFLCPWEEKDYLNSRERGGVIEFHYDKRRSFSFGFSDFNMDSPQWHYTLHNTYFFKGSYDTVGISGLNGNTSTFSFTGERNGEYFGQKEAMVFDADAADAFRAIVISCIE
ncbi:MAG: hypothetical protein IJW51_05060 [Clostridia bacterium]|nr:hypothetical protein [Clostridia bacterium]